MAAKAIKFRKVLNQAYGGDANYLFLGDLNNMGLEYPYNKDIDPETELKRWDYRAETGNQKRMPETADWRQGIRILAFGGDYPIPNS
jgi:hypothetical protein